MLGVPFTFETTSEHSVFLIEITDKRQQIERLLDTLTWKTRAPRQRVMNFCGLHITANGKERDWNWIEFCWARGRYFPFTLIFWQKTANLCILHNYFFRIPIKTYQWVTLTSLSPELTTTQHRVTLFLLINP